MHGRFVYLKRFWMVQSYSIACPLTERLFLLSKTFGDACGAAVDGKCCVVTGTKRSAIQ